MSSMLLSRMQLVIGIIAMVVIGSACQCLVIATPISRLRSVATDRDSILQPYDHNLIESSGSVDLKVEAAARIAATGGTVADECRAMGIDSCDVGVLREAATEWVRQYLPVPAGLFVVKKNARLRRNPQDPENVITVADVQAVLGELSPTYRRGRLVSAPIRADGVFGAGGPKTDLNPKTPAVTSTLTYTYGNRGQLREVAGSIVEGPGTNAQAAFWINSAYRVVFGTDKPPRMEQGHIVAASLGGSNTNVHNFFPQSDKSNRGAYYGIENRALALVRSQLLEGCTKIRITFEYNGISPFIASDGTYTLQSNQRTSCFPTVLNVADDTWITETINWTNFPASFTVTVPPLTTVNHLYTIPVTPTWNPVPVGGFTLTVTRVAGAGILTNGVLNFAAGPLTTQNFNYQTPAQAGPVTFHFDLTPNVNNHYVYESPSDLLVAMPSFTIPGGAAQQTANSNRIYQVTLAAPDGSDLLARLTAGETVTLTPNPSAGAIIAGGVLTWAQADLNTAQMTKPFTLQAPARGPVTIQYVVGGLAGVAVAAPANNNLLVPSIAVTGFPLNNQVHANSITQPITLTQTGIAGGVRVTINVVGGGVANPTHVDFAAGPNHPPQTFTFTAPPGQGQVTISYAITARQGPPLQHSFGAIPDNVITVV